MKFLYQKNPVYNFTLKSIVCYGFFGCWKIHSVEFSGTENLSEKIFLCSKNKITKNYNTINNVILIYGHNKNLRGSF
jgi:hypothetical protein